MPNFLESEVGYLTLTRVVFECANVTLIKVVLVDLTLTRVVFEFVVLVFCSPFP